MEVRDYQKSEMKRKESKPLGLSKLSLRKQSEMLPRIKSNKMGISKDLLIPEELERIKLAKNKMLSRDTTAKNLDFAEHSATYEMDGSNVFASGAPSDAGGPFHRRHASTIVSRH